MIVSLLAYAAGSAAFAATERYVERRHERMRLRRAARRPSHTTPAPPPGRMPGEPPGPGPGVGGEIGAIPTCGPGEMVIPLQDGGWACLPIPPDAQHIAEGADCDDEGAWVGDLECVNGVWHEPASGQPCTSDGASHKNLHCAEGTWHHPEWNGPCSPSGAFSRDQTLQCVGASWQPAADGRMCSTPGQWHPTLPLYCDNSQHWRAPTEGGPCAQKGQRAPGRHDLICFDGTWRKAMSCPAAAAACLSVPIPGVPRYACWAMTGNCD